MSEQIDVAGSFNLNSANVYIPETEGYIDIREQVDGITIFEDIYSPFITGKLTIRDTYNLTDTIFWTGLDILELDIECPVLKKYGNFAPGTGSLDEIKGKFWIYKIGDRELVKTRTQMFNLYFISIEAMGDSFEHVSRTFKGTANEIATEIHEKYFKKFAFEGEHKDLIIPALSDNNSVEVLKYTSNFWTPSKNMIYLSTHAKTESGDSSFLFFENRQGFNFCTISAIAEQPEEYAPTFSNLNYSTSVNQSGRSTKNLATDYKTIIGSFRVLSMLDFLRAYTNGGIKTAMTTFDIMKKKVDYLESFPSSTPTPILNKKPMIENKLIETVSPMRMAMMKEFDSMGTNANDTNSGYIQKRFLETVRLKESRIEIDVLGRTDYTVGKKVFVEIVAPVPMSKEDSAEKIIDKKYSGFYVITACRHEFTRENHKCTLELSKESFLE